MELAKEERIKRAKKALDEQYISYSEYNNGIHLKTDCKIDFYPTTGKWRAKSGASGNSLRSLITYVLGVDPTGGSNGRGT